MTPFGDDVPDGGGGAQRKLSINPVDRNVAATRFGLAHDCRSLFKLGEVRKS